jgi:hypothetical protein
VTELGAGDTTDRPVPENSEVKEAVYSRNRFQGRFTQADIELLAKVDEAHETLSGPATRKILEREWGIYQHAGYERLATGFGGPHVQSVQAPALPRVPDKLQQNARVPARRHRASGRSGRGIECVHLTVRLQYLTRLPPPENRQILALGFSSSVYNQMSRLWRQALFFRSLRF